MKKLVNILTLTFALLFASSSIVDAASRSSGSRSFGGSRSSGGWGSSSSKSTSSGSRSSGGWFSGNKSKATPAKPITTLGKDTDSVGLCC